jgi:hypothetical protein
MFIKKKERERKKTREKGLEKEQNKKGVRGLAIMG